MESPVASNPAEVVLTQDVSSGRIHKRYKTAGGNLASFEGCNLDDAGDYRVVGWDVLDTAEVGQLCENDFSIKDLAVPESEE